MKKTQLFLYVAIAFFLVRCASYKAQYEDKNAAKTIKSTKEIAHTFYLIGDAGNAETKKPLPSLEYFQKDLTSAKKNSTAIFLGDNVYPNGIPPKENIDYEFSKLKLQTQIDAVKTFNGKTIFIPGNHDWYNGVDGLKRQEKLVEKTLGKGSFLPEGGCGLKKVNINNELTLIVIDSRWFLMDWDKEPKMNDNCDLKTREAFINEVWGLFKKNRYKNVVVAMHHPMYSNGPHGGSFSFKDHIKPIPVIGTIKNAIRSHAGIQTDIFNKNYAHFISRLQFIASDFAKHIVFVSGHEHNLQYIEKPPLKGTSNLLFKQVISGAGSKKSAAKLGDGAQFTYGNYGYTKLIYYKDGSAVVEFYSANSKDGNALLFSKEIVKPLNKVNPKDFDFSEFHQHKKQVTTSLYTKEQTNVTGFHKFFWGNLNREKYGKEITVPVLELDKVLGGLKPIRRGGGNQTNSLRLENAEGKQYVLRSMYKDGSRIMGGALKGTFLVDVVQDIFTMSHPYAAFVIPDMAEAINIYHTNPKLYYLPKQPALAQYNDIFGGGLYLLEERPAGNREDVNSFGNSKKIISTPDVLEEIRKNGNHTVDQHWAIRSRLFDMIIGDWDRHEDQWRWASFKTEKGKTFYRPIPRDRDQPFSRFDGIAIPMFKKNVHIVKNMQSFENDIQDMKWYNNYPRFFDTEFLNQLTLKDWLTQAAYIQRNLTDDVIEKSIQKLPKNIFNIDGKLIISKIKARRNILKNIVERYYKRLAKKVLVVGTDKDDEFIIERLTNQETKVTVNRLKKSGKIKIYERIFKTDETNEIQLYGLNGDDIFTISGDVDNSILLRLIGGQNHDVYNDSSSVSGWSKKTKVYDFKAKKNTINGSKETADLRSDSYFKNAYNHHDIQNNTWITLPVIGANPDDGVFFGVHLNHTRYGFKKRPFDNSHDLNINYYNSTNGFDLEYNGEFTEFIGDWSLHLRAKSTSDNYAINFFGWGNNTTFNMPTGNTQDDLDFYRVKLSELSFSPSLLKRFRGGSIFKLSTLIEGIAIDNTPNRIITNATGNTTNLFDTNYFLGAELSFNHNRVDNASFPTKGMNFDVSLGAKSLVDNFDTRFGYFKGSLALYQNLASNRTVIFASEIGTQINIGNQFEFYQGATIGGGSSLRGFNRQRFTGKESFYHSNDIRARFGKFRFGIPMKYGVSAGFDYGKVWTPLVAKSNTWHTSYGGSFWFSGLDLFTANISYYQSDFSEENRFSFGIGFAF